jgi:hypothetical protein
MHSHLKFRLSSFSVECYINRLISLMKTDFNLFFILFFVLFYSYENLFFLSSYEFVPLREVNELAFQISLRDFYWDLKSGSLSSLLRSGDYAYGFIFWAIYGFVLTPFYLVLDYFPSLNYFNIVEKLIIFIPRELSLLLTTFGLIKWMAIVKVISKSKILLFTFCTILFTSPIISYSSTTLHTTSLLFFLGSFFFSYFFKIYYSSVFKKSDFFYLTLYLALAISVKLSGFVFLPFYFSIVFIALKRNQYNLAKLLGPKFLFIPLIMNLSISPLVIYDFFILDNSNFINNVTGQLGNKSLPIESTLFFRLFHGLHGYIFSSINVFIFIAFLTVFLCLIPMRTYLHLNEIKLSEIKLFFLLSSNFFFTYGLFAYAINLSSFQLSNYAMPIYPILIILLVLSLTLFSRRIVSTVLILFTILNVTFNFSNFFYINSKTIDPRNLSIRPINYFQSLASGPSFVLEYNSFNRIKDLGIGDLQKSNSILIDYRALIPVNPLTIDADFLYTFDDEDQYIPRLLSLEFDHVILSNSSKGARIFKDDPLCTSLANTVDFNLCNLRRILLSENMCNDTDCYTVVFSDGSIHILKKSKLLN